MVQPVTSPELRAADHAVERIPCPLRARAWWGDRLVAESTATVRVEEEGQPPTLYFPWADVRFDLLGDEGRRTTCPVKGHARLWSIARAEAGAGAGPAEGSSPTGAAEPDGPDGREGFGATGAATEFDGSEGSDVTAAAGPAQPDGGGGFGATAVAGPAQQDERDGRDVLWSYTEPQPAVGWLRGMVAFDHDRVRVELEDAAEGDDPRDVTVKRFPTWGDAGHLVEVLDVLPAGERRWVSVARSDWRRPVVEGSQMLGQAIVAAGRHAPSRRVVSAHMVLVRPADARHPLDLALEEVASGRTFTTVTVHVGQGGRRCATGTLLLDATAPDVIRHAAPPPDVAGPHDSEPCDMAVTGRDVRIVDGAYTGDPAAPIGPPVLDAWVRFRDLPPDPVLHAGLLAQFTGHLSIAAALRPHEGVGQDQAHRTLSTAINAIALSLHGEVRADRWMLYRHRSTFAGDGMTHAECRVHDEDGGLVASFSVDAMVRRFPGGPTATDQRDERTAL